MKILGIDPGFGRIGWGVIEKTKRDWVAVDFGCIETSAKLEFVDRLKQLFDEVTGLIKKYQPGRVAVEELFFFKNVTTAIQVGQARGVILLAAVQAGLPVDEFTPLQIKQAMTGYGRADKGQMQKLVAMLLGVKVPIKSDDAADALAVALTAGSCQSFNNRLKNSG
jgi:crossover junction endodeoxyribonuclease RuvC